MLAQNVLDRDRDRERGGFEHNVAAQDLETEPDRVAVLADPGLRCRASGSRSSPTAISHELQVSEPSSGSLHSWGQRQTFERRSAHRRRDLLPTRGSSGGSGACRGPPFAIARLRRPTRTPAPPVRSATRAWRSDAAYTWRLCRACQVYAAYRFRHPEPLSSFSKHQCVRQVRSDSPLRYQR